MINSEIVSSFTKFVSLTMIRGLSSAMPYFKLRCFYLLGPSMLTFNYNSIH